jgi:Flp pilus assembly protein TadG
MISEERSMHSLLKDQKGQAIVEMALIMLIFLFTIFGITEFSRALYTYNTIVQSTRAAARWGVVNVAGNADSTNIDRVRNIVVYGDPNTSSGNPLLTGLSKSLVNVSIDTLEADSSGIAISQRISVNVSGYQFQSLVPSITIPAFETSLYTESMGYTG